MSNSIGAAVAGVRAAGIEDDSRARRGIELDHELVRLGPTLELREAETGRVLEHETDLGLRHREPLAATDEERDARPAPVVDLKPERCVRLGGRVRCDAVDPEVALVLAAHVVSRVCWPDRAVERDLGVLECLRVASRRGLHRRRAHDLHEVVDDDVPERADRVVEVAAILDAEVLRHRDLHALDVVPVPDRLEHRVREPEVDDLLEAHLPEVVVDPQQLRLVDVLMQLVGELACGRLIVAERLLDHDPCVRRHACSCEAADDRAEERGWNLEVEDRALRALDRFRDLCVGGVVGEVSVTIREPLREPRNTSSSSCSPVPTIDSRARWTSCSSVQSSNATPTIGQSRSPRCSSRYSEWNVITFARSPVIPKITRTSAGRASAPVFVPVACGACVALIPPPLSVVAADDARAMPASLGRIRLWCQERPGSRFPAIAFHPGRELALPPVPRSTHPGRP